MTDKHKKNKAKQKERKEGRIDEIKRNLLGSLEVALFMHIARDRFGNTLEEAIRSFYVPIVLFPLTLFALYLYPQDGIKAFDPDSLALMFSLRTAIMWLLFFGAIYWITSQIDRRQYFYQFIIATNWLSVPSTLVFVPVAWMLLSGTHTWAELHPFMVCLMLYTYAFTAFMAVWVLRVPWELGGFIVFIGMAVQDNSYNLLSWIGETFLG